MRVAPRPSRTGARPGPWQQFVEGWRYAFGFRPIRSIILLLALVSLVGVPYSVLMPIFAASVFHGGPHTLGLLMGASGCGALAGALWLASRQSVVGLGRVIIAACAAFGAGLIGFALAPTVWLAIPCLVVAGCGFIIQMASSNTIIQTIVDDDKRGRVMSFYMMAFLGTAPFGSLIAGWMSSRLGAPHTLLVGGLCCVGGAAWFAAELPALRTAVRPIYIRMGILPQVAAGISEAAELSVPPERQ
jgi:MFS family permease